jgi:hypothetical protein
MQHRLSCPSCCLLLLFEVVEAVLFNNRAYSTLPSKAGVASDPPYWQGSGQTGTFEAPFTKGCALEIQGQTQLTVEK